YLLYLHSFPTRRSSDLDAEGHQHGHVTQAAPAGLLAEQLTLAEGEEGAGRAGGQNEEAEAEDVLCPGVRLERAEHREERRIHQRSEEHTSELQSRSDLV